MSNPADSVASSFAFLRIAALLFALWLASRFEPRIWYLTNGRHSMSTHAGPRTIAWLVLGSISSLFLFDLTGLLHLLVEVISPVAWGLAYGMVPTFWGSVTTRLFDGFSIATTLAVYAAVFVSLRGWLREESPPALRTLAQSGADRILVMAAISGLVSLIVRSIVLQVVLIELPGAVTPIDQGGIGPVVAWLVGMLFALAFVQWFRFRSAASDARNR
jgi:hypothetical protein